MKAVGSNSTQLDFSGPEAIYDPTNGYVYVINTPGCHASPCQSYVEVISGTSTIASTPVGFYAQGLAFDSTSGVIYVANEYSRNVSLIEGTSVINSVSVGGEPTSCGFDAANGFIYVSVNGISSSNVTVINGSSTLASIPVGADPTAVAYDSSNGYVYVANTRAENISVINGLSVVASIPDPTPTIGSPTFISATYDPVTGYVYIPSDGGPSASNVSVINGTKLIGYIPLGWSPMAEGFDSTNGYVYVSAGTSIYVLNDTWEVHILTGFYVNAIAFDSTSGDLYLFGYPSAVVDGSYYYPAIYSLTSSEEPVQLGSTTSIRVQSGDGNGPLTYSYSGLPPGCSSENTSVLLCKPVLPGNFSVSARVSDSGGNNATAGIALLVVAPIDLTVSSSSSTPAIGQVMSINAEASGGFGPLSYKYLGLPPGCASMNSSKLSCTPTEEGAFNISVTVRDGYVDNATQKVTITVHSASNAGLPLIQSWGFQIMLIAAGLAIAAAVGYVYGKRRSVRILPTNAVTSKSLDPDPINKADENGGGTPPNSSEK